MIRIISLTKQGKKLAEKLKHLQPYSEIWHKPKPFSERIQQAFQKGDALIMICATGIVVRTLAPVLKDKLQDPPVLVLDEQGEFVIPLLSGHEGGANRWANEVANHLSAQLVITTTNTYLKPVYTVGMGCERGCSQEHLLELFLSCIKQVGLDISQIESLNSIALKADEVGLIALAKQIGKPYFVWEAEELAQVESQLNSRSDYVFSITGVYGVAESAALFSAQAATKSSNKADLILIKQKTDKATCAIACISP